MTTATKTKAKAAPAPKAKAKGHVPMQPMTRGVHHLALNTDDMKKTIDFYVDVLGMPLVHALKVPAGLGTGPLNRGNPPYENLRHYFFDMGNDSLLAFFEIPKGKEPEGNRNAIAAMQHVSFAITEARFEAIREKLEGLGIEYLGPMEVLPGVFSMYFFDPNNIRLELSCQPADGAAPKVVRGCTQNAEAMRKELLTLTDDRVWIEQRVAELGE
ncbi:MAG TPA: VOC family protein [Alphaproteobacteria bacterium]|jgi:catechol 2,3-dioxygenase-like lactoylglutathione lyase family enzyme|nr:VOC family protein [Alphaproteobacteria bacterium]